MCVENTCFNFGVKMMVLKVVCLKNIFSTLMFQRICREKIST